MDFICNDTNIIQGLDLWQYYDQKRDPKKPAKIANSGAVRKNLSGADIGGAWSALRPVNSILQPTPLSSSPSYQQFSQTLHLSVVEPLYITFAPLSYCAVALKSSKFH